MAKGTNWDLYGSFDYCGLVCRLIGSDFATWGDKLEEIEDPVAPAFAAMFSDALCRSALHGRQTIPLLVLPNRLTDASRGRLQHERMHYWQCISLTFLQQRTVLFIDRVHNWHCALSDPEYPNDARTKRWQRLDAIYDCVMPWIPFDSKSWFASFAPTTDRPFVFPLHARSGHVIPGAGVVLGMSETSENAHVSFSVVSLVESAVSVAQALHDEAPLPRLSRPISNDAVVYHGCWECWRRQHGALYADETRLAESFLGAVDLALHIGHGCSLIETFSSVQKRFAHLIVAAQSVPFEIPAGEEPAVAMHRWQTELCSTVGWSPPLGHARYSALLLTRNLLMFWKHLWKAEHHTMWAALEADETAEHLSSDLHELNPLWDDLISRNSLDPRPVPGQYVLAVMLAAARQRLLGANIFAMPHRYSKKLAYMFPLPIVLLNGIYYSDFPATESLRGDFAEQCSMPFLEGLTEDAFSLATLAYLGRSTAHACGLVDPATSSPKCMFSRFGFGCPQVGCNAEESQRRADAGLDDWCHYTYSTIATGNAPQGVIDKWFERLSRTAPPRGT